MAFKFETFDAWKRAIQLADELFDVADGLPQQYQFSLGEQLRRVPYRFLRIWQRAAVGTMLRRSTTSTAWRKDLCMR